MDLETGISGQDAFVGTDPIPYYSPVAAQKRLHRLMSNRYHNEMHGVLAMDDVLAMLAVVARSGLGRSNKKRRR